MKTTSGRVLDPESGLDVDEIAALEIERALLLNAAQTLNNSQELADVIDLAEQVEDLGGTVARLEDATDADSLDEALRSAANPNREVTEEVTEWASIQLDRLIEDYIAQQ